MNMLPPVRRSHTIGVICEGLEDFEYFKRLKDLKVWDG